MALHSSLEGVGLDGDSPSYFLRERLIANQSNKAKLPKLEIAALLIKALTAESEGRTLRTLRWSAGAKEAFPSLPGLRKKIDA
jgi:hypothetical protein